MSAGTYPHGFHAQSLGGFQIGQVVLHHDALAWVEFFFVQQPEESAGRRLGLKTKPFDGVDGVKVLTNAGNRQYGFGVFQRRIGKNDFSAWKAFEHGFQAGFEDDHRFQFGKQVGMVQEVFGVGS